MFAGTKIHYIYDFPALCTHRPSLLPMNVPMKFSGKKPPRTGRFFIIDANNNRKKNAVVVSMKKKTTGGQPQEKNHRRERRIRNPRTQTPIRCQRIHTEARRATPPNKSEPNRTPQIEPRWFKPLENDSILIFFCFTRTTS